MTALVNLPMETPRIHLGWSEISSGGGTTGFPWSGYEEHWRDLDDENIIRYILSSWQTRIRTASARQPGSGPIAFA